MSAITGAQPCACILTQDRSQNGWKLGKPRNAPRYEDHRARLLAHTRVGPPEHCWIWEGNLSKWGYGTLGVNDKTLLAHRLSWLIFRGPLNELLVLHRCDTPACVNPNHLFLGTHKDNNDDMRAKGRHRYMHGEGTGAHKLTAAQVREIRTHFGTLSDCEIARRYNVSSGCIRHMRLGLSWRHLS